MLKNINIKSKITLLVLGIIIMCLVMVGVSYAYFSVNVENTGNVTVIESGTLSLKLVDGDAITLDNAIPGSKLTKTFSVTNTGTLDATYDIYFSEVINTFADKSDLAYTVTSSNSTCTKSETEIPYKADKLIDSCDIKSGKTQNYTFTILFKETNDNQDDNQGKRFQTRISINEYKNIAFLDTGENFNTALKTLAGDSDANPGTADTNITKIASVTSLPDGVTTSVVSIEDSLPIYAYYDTGTINLYSEADTYYTNENATAMYMNITKLTDVDLSMLNTSLTTNMSAMFDNCSSLTSINLSGFDTSNVTNMTSLLYGNTNLVELNISNFIVNKQVEQYFLHYCLKDSKIKTLIAKNCVFNSGLYDALYEVNYIETVDFSNSIFACDILYMFLGATNLKNLDLSGVDMSNITTTDLSGLFLDCSSLTNIDISMLNTSNVTSIGHMFMGCTSLENIDLSNFDTSKVTDMNVLFKGDTALKTINMDGFNVTKASLGGMFNGCTSLESISMKNWKIGSSMTQMLGNRTSNNTTTSVLDVTGWDLSDTLDISGLFGNCSTKEIIGLDTWDTSHITNMSDMFFNLSEVQSMDLSNWDISNVTNMTEMFYGDSKLTSLNLNNWKFNSNVKVQTMFGGDSLVTSLNMNNWDTSAMISMETLFSGLSGIQSLDLTSFDTSKVTKMGGMFFGCASISSLNLSSFDTSNVTNMDVMFNSDNNLKTITVSDKFVTTNVTSGDGMFTDCTSLVGGNGTPYNKNNTNYTYARVDTSSTPGYFTLKS